MMNHVFLSLGGNEGDTFSYLQNAHKLIGKEIGEIIQTSHLYRTKAWGKENQNDFLNECIEVITLCSPQEVLSICLDIETRLGRKRKEKWGARPIDIDILLFNDSIIQEPNLIVPHPYLHERNFVLIPLEEIAADKIHPIFKRDIRTLREESIDPLSVERLENAVE